MRGKEAKRSSGRRRIGRTREQRLFDKPRVGRTVAECSWPRVKEGAARMEERRGGGVEPSAQRGRGRSTALLPACAPCCDAAWKSRGDGALRGVASRCEMLLRDPGRGMERRPARKLGGVEPWRTARQGVRTPPSLGSNAPSRPASFKSRGFPRSARPCESVSGALPLSLPSAQSFSKHVQHRMQTQTR